MANVLGEFKECDSIVQTQMNSWSDNERNVARTILSHPDQLVGVYFSNMQGFNKKSDNAWVSSSMIRPVDFGYKLKLMTSARRCQSLGSLYFKFRFDVGSIVVPDGVTHIRKSNTIGSSDIIYVDFWSPLLHEFMSSQKSDNVTNAVKNVVNSINNFYKG